MKEIIGKRVRERRRAMDMSQDELASKSYISRATISMIENGKCNDILIGTLTAIASALDTTIEFFFE